MTNPLTLPNVRKLFIPDPGYIIGDFDLAQADAQVVAWEADDELLKAIFRDPDADLHTENAKTIFGYCNDKKRKLAKAGVHATNYAAGPRTLARALGITTHEAELFQRKWFSAHPGIKDWHRRVQDSLTHTRTVTNKFGFRRMYFDRIDGILPEALAWIPQSTVALCIDKGLVAVEENIPEVEPLLQVHDSFVLQWEKRYHPHILQRIRKHGEVVVPYNDPLIIPLGAAVSDRSWGDVVDVDWDGNPVG